jgi:hypothetical protein
LLLAPCLTGLLISPRIILADNKSLEFQGPLLFYIVIAVIISSLEMLPTADGAEFVVNSLVGLLFDAGRFLSDARGLSSFDASVCIRAVGNGNFCFVY